MIIWALRKYFPDVTSFLEIGCGTGFVLSEIERAFPKMQLSGSEIFSSGLSYAAQRVSRADLFQMDACRIPFENEFSVIGAFDVLEHIDNDELVLSQMHQAIIPGGGIIITVPQHAFLWSQTDEYSHHVRRYNVHDLRHKVEMAGFKVVRTTSFVALLLPLMMMSRLRKRTASEDFDVMEELRIGGTLNSLMEKVLDLERKIISVGLSFPLGGSLVLIARKD